MSDCVIGPIETTYCIEWENVGMDCLAVNLELINFDYLAAINHSQPDAEARIADSDLAVPELEAALKILADGILRHHLFCGNSILWSTLLDGYNGIRLVNVEPRLPALTTFTSAAFKPWRIPANGPGITPPKSSPYRPANSAGTRWHRCRNTLGQ